MQQGTMELLWRSSHISGGNAVYVEAMYEAYLRDPNSIAAQWRDYFDRLPQVDGTRIDVPHSTVDVYKRQGLITDFSQGLPNIMCRKFAE